MSLPEPRPPASRIQRWMPWIALVPFAVLVGAFAFLTDDGFISFRYAQNFAAGHGLVFNVGEDPRVEGYSNLLWVLWLALLERLGLDVTVWDNGSSVLCGAALVVVRSRGLHRQPPLGPALLAATALFLACFPPLAVWSTGGLATMPFALTVLLVFDALLGEEGRPRPGRASAWAVVAVLLRADGFVWLALVLAGGFVSSFVQRRPALRRASLLVGVATAAAFAAVTAWRLAYYGDWQPNTARVKVGVSAMTLERGAKYVGTLLATFPALALALLLPLVRRAPLRCGIGLAAAGIVLGGMAYCTVVGGDYLTMGRFLVPALPFFALLLGIGLQRLSSGPAGRRAALGLAGLCIVGSVLPGFGLHVTPLALREALHFRWKRANDKYQSEHREWVGTVRVNARRRELGRALGLFTQPGESIILKAVGAAGYYSELFIHDQWGLVDREVALRADVERVRSSPGHDKGVEPEFFLPRRPTYYSARVVDSGPEPRAPRNLAVNVVVEAHPLPEDQGFDPGRELWLYRIVYEE